jgi:hypothetical protein
LSIDGIPEEFYVLSTNLISRLNVDQEVKIPIEFVITENASTINYVGSFIVEFDNEKLQKQFLLSISAKEMANTTTAANESGGTRPIFKLPQLKLPTIRVILPEINGDLLIITGFGVVSFTSAYILKKKRQKTREKKVERNEIKNMLLNIETEIRRKPIETKKKKNNVYK